MNILIADKFEPAGVEKLVALGCSVTQDIELCGDSLVQAVTDSAAEVLIVRSTDVEEATLDAGADLKLVIRAGAGYNTIKFKYARRKGIAVANCPGMNSIAVVELSFGLMLALDRRIVDNTVDLRNGVWNKKEYSKVTRARGLKGRTVGIIGLGQIGAGIARRAKAFEMNSLYFDVIDCPGLEKELGIEKVDLKTLYKQSDFITLHVPLNDATEHMVSTAQFAMMKPTAFVINCSRGGVVDQQALVKALDEGQIAGAGLDVYENEPGAGGKVFADPVMNHPKVYGTHHIGASTEQAQLAVADEVVRIIEKFKTAGEVLNCVN
ncbi:MAG: phosphoglycerate dehydrogenase [Phycisphaerae bacterium]|nr:phosphoglycerate dehydrogenase [Phycisphaerae bacterium]